MEENYQNSKDGVKGENMLNWYKDWQDFIINEIWPEV